MPLELITRHISEDHKRKISKALKGRKLSEEHKKNLSENRIGYSLIGERIGRLRVISRTIRPAMVNNTWNYWKCICDCGNSVLVPTVGLTHGTSRSCGCLQKDVAREICKNRRKIGSNNYIQLHKPNHPNANQSGCIKEHILIMSEFLKRPLMPEETVHHKNGIRTDNRIENLELWTKNHGNGQRIEDVISFAIDILKKYSPESLRETSCHWN
jgi:hypothetical protein